MKYKKYFGFISIQATETQVASNMLRRTLNSGGSTCLQPVLYNPLDRFYCGIILMPKHGAIFCCI